MIKVVFWGTPNIGVKTLKYLAASKDFDVGLIVLSYSNNNSNKIIFNKY